MAETNLGNPDLNRVERDLADLMNQAGKMRMLSHRTVMFGLLSQVDPRHGQSRDAALSEFCRLMAVLSEPKTAGKLGPLALSALTEVTAISGAHLETLRQFSILAQAAIDGRKGSETFEELGDFVGGRLLADLNSIVEGVQRAIEHVGKRRADAKRPLISKMETSLNQLDRLAKSLQIVATNASIEAQRAGDAGRGFRIISEEMRNLSQQSRSQAEHLGSLFEDVTHSGGV
ncbi:MAG: methyl-accepting chemotaxis protein [Pseudomonadota bacterium]